MDDIHSINAAINKKAGRKLLPSIIVSIAILGVVFGTLKIHAGLFTGLVLLAVVVAIQELNHGFKLAGIIIPDYILQVASVGVVLAAYFGKVSGLSVAAAIAIPNLWILLLAFAPADFIKRISAASAAIFYVPFLAGFIILLAHDSDGIARILTLVVLVACNDTFAYIFGVLFGRHRLAPHISPKKTWEGLIGSLVATTTGAALIFHFVFHKHWWLGLLLGLMGVATATAGDLIESAIKRDLNIKDMGSLLPGHGGVLDRIDSVLFTGPAVWFVLELIKHWKL
jgi:phosphatidate cytidylyltransferase